MGTYKASFVDIKPENIGEIIISLPWQTWAMMIVKKVETKLEKLFCYPNRPTELVGKSF